MELDSKALKDSKEMENHISTISKLKETKFELRSIVYCLTDNEFVQIKTYDEEKNVYGVRHMQSDKDAAVVSHPYESLSKHIVVQVKNLKTNQSENDIFFLNVKINENLSKIQEVLGEDGVTGFLTYNGKLVENP